MASLGELQQQVEATYHQFVMPSWVDPHPGMNQPLQDEYSRVTEPGRYRIVHTRARVWAETLSGLPGVTAMTLEPAMLDHGGHLGRFDRGVQLTSAREGTLPLLLLERDVRLPGHEAAQAVLHISITEPDVAIDMLPDCGCDACDSGSDDLLRAIDATIGLVVGGPFVALRANGWHAQWHPGGGGSGGTGRGPDHAQVMELCRRLAARESVPLPAGAKAFVGRSWLS